VASVIHSAESLAEKYRVDLDHARNVTDMAVRLFDELQTDHGLGARHRLLLRVAGLLHEVGSFVSNLAHHKHSCYLIGNSEIFGLNRDDTEIVAHVARYHRRSSPKPSHLEYIALPRESRVVVNKLAAILRVADALARTRGRKIVNPHFQRRGDEFVISLPGAADLVLERRSLAVKGDMFEDVYGMTLRLEEG
jgi:exopolyphosphatase/guanosine-5'-triphosphate,3'-diphosphate pyrophosphatase